MRTPRIVVLLIIAATWSPVARATDVQMTSSTQFLWYQDFLSDDAKQNEVAENLRLNVVGLDTKGKINVYGYGRVIRQLTTSIEPRNEIGHKTYGRLSYLYLDARDVIQDHLDLRLGRTYVPAAALPGVVDGLYLNLRNVGIAGVGVTTFGGHRATFDNKAEISYAGDAVAGGSVYVDAPRFTHLEASYARKWADTEFAQEYVALDLTSTPLSTVSLLGRAKYDLPSSQWAELQAGVSVIPLAPLVLKGEVYASRPSFDRFSFYRFFNVNRFLELAAAAEYEVVAGVRVNARYAYEDFGDDANAHVVEGGLALRPVKNLSLNAVYQNRNGFGGRVSGLRGSGAYTIGKATVLAGVDYDDFRRQLSREGTSKKYWAGLNVEINRFLSAAVHAENTLSFYFSHAYQGIAALIVTL